MEEPDLTKPDPARRLTFEQSMERMKNDPVFQAELRALAPYDHTFQVTAWPYGSWWVLEIEAPSWALSGKERGYWVTQTPWLRLAEYMAKDCLACTLDLDYKLWDQITVNVVRGIGPVEDDNEHPIRSWLTGIQYGIRDSYYKWCIERDAKRARREAAAKRVSSPT